MDILNQGFIEYIFSTGAIKISLAFEAEVLKVAKEQWNRDQSGTPTSELTFFAWFPVEELEENDWVAIINLIATITIDEKEYEGDIYFGLDLKKGGKPSIDYNNTNFIKKAL